MSNNAFATQSLQGRGPLRVHPDNPGYFTDDSGEPILLAGGQTWATLQERRGAETPLFDYDGWLRFLNDHGLNYMRMWTWEHPYGMQFTDRDIWYYPHWYRRTGPGLARDGEPKFDLEQLDPYTLERLRYRVERAAERGIYVTVMLFQGFSLDKTGGKPFGRNAFDYHPMNGENNVNGIDGDAGGDGTGFAVHALQNPTITALQERRVKAIVKTLNGFDNLLWEITNESHSDSVEWQYHMISHIRNLEKELPKQHLIGMSGAPVRNQALLESDADWMGPCSEDQPGGWVPEGMDAGKIIIADTDHLGYQVNDRFWPWKCMLRGQHFCIMDPYMDARFCAPRSPILEWDGIRQEAGRARRVLSELPIASMRPAQELVSGSDYCLALPGEHYIALVEHETITVRGVTNGARYRVRWLGFGTDEQWSQEVRADARTSDLTLTSPKAWHKVVHVERDAGSTTETTVSDARG